MEFTNNFTISPNVTLRPVVIGQPPFCLRIITEEILNSRVRIWDVIILIPNAAFLLFLLVKLKSAVAKLATTSSPIFLAFYGLVFLVAVISVLRCIVSMTVNASVLAGDITDKVLWLILRFFLLATEMSVIVFGLAFGHLDSRTSIRLVLAVTFTLSLIYSTTQGTLEFIYPDPQFTAKQKTPDSYAIFAHGGMIFWFASSLIFFLVYTTIFVLPHTQLCHRLPLPSKRSFYLYCLFLSALNLTQAIGSILLYNAVDHCMCVVNFTAYVYFSFFDPLVYGTFLREFFRRQAPSIMYSYKQHQDEGTDDDTVAMPYQARYSHDDAFAINSYNSTHFDDINSSSSHFDDAQLDARFDPTSTDSTTNADETRNYDSTYRSPDPAGSSHVTLSRRDFDTDQLTDA